MVPLKGHDGDPCDDGVMAVFGVIQARFGL